jgi:hypothetical protein
MRMSIGAESLIVTRFHIQSVGHGKKPIVFGNQIEL